MSHLARDKSKLIGRIKRLKGQMEAVERAIESDADCAEVLQLVASIRGATAGLTTELIEEHLRHHIAGVDDAAARDEGAEQLVAVIRTYMK